MSEDTKHLISLIRRVPDFPKPGILFYDISTLLDDGAALKETVEKLASLVKRETFDTIAAIESRGFIFGAALALHFNCGLVLIRKKGKLPGKTVSTDYALEYGTATIEMTDIAFLKSGKRVLLVDDVLATGGTAAAAVDLIEKCGGSVAHALFLIELLELNGRRLLKDTPTSSLISFGTK